MAKIWEAELVGEKYWEVAPPLLISARGFRRLLQVGDSIPMGRGKLEYIKEEGCFYLRRVSAKGNEVYKKPIHTTFAYRVGSHRMHKKVEADKELDPLKRVLREMEIPIKVLRPFESDLELNLQTDPQTCEWHYSHHEAYYTDGSAKDNMMERMYRGSYSAEVTSANCIIVVRNETEPVWSQTEDHKVDWTRDASWIKQVYVTDDCTPETLRSLLEEADRDYHFRIYSLLAQWGLDVEVLGFQDELVLDLDNDAFDVDFHSDCSGSRDELAYTDGQDQVDLKPQGVQDRHRIKDASVVIVLASTRYLGGTEVNEVQKIYLNKADFKTFESLLKKANQEHTFNEWKLEEEPAS